MLNNILFNYDLRCYFFFTFALSFLFTFTFCWWTWHSEGLIFHFYLRRERPCFVLNDERAIITISLGDDVALVSSTMAGVFVNRWLLMTADHPSARNHFPTSRSSPCSIEPSVPLTYINSSSHPWATSIILLNLNCRKCITIYDSRIKNNMNNS